MLYVMPPCFKTCDASVYFTLPILQSKPKSRPTVRYTYDILIMERAATTAPGRPKALHEEEY